MTPSTPILRLPTELYLIIADNLDLLSLTYLKRTNHHLHDIIKGPQTPQQLHHAQTFLRNSTYCPDSRNYYAYFTCRRLRHISKFDGSQQLGSSRRGSYTWFPCLRFCMECGISAVSRFGNRFRRCKRCKGFVKADSDVDERWPCSESNYNPFVEDPQEAWDRCLSE